MVSKFYIVTAVFKTCRRQISITISKYYESPFEKLRVRKNSIMIIKLSKNNSNKSNNEYYNLKSIFEKFILWIWTCQKSGYAQKISKHPFSVFHIIPFRMSFECFQRYPIGFVPGANFGRLPELDHRATVGPTLATKVWWP